jgi:CheY-like chemotaxis protein
MDAEIFQEALREVSPRAGVYCVTSGEEALRFLSRADQSKEVGPVKLMILDLNMPGLNGFETLHRIRNNPDLSCVPVIISLPQKLQERWTARTRWEQTLVSANRVHCQFTSNRFAWLFSIGSSLHSCHRQFAYQEHRLPDREHLQ